MAEVRSTDRVRAALLSAGLPDTIVRMPSSTRTAEEAAKACGCAVGQIVKSLIFQAGEDGRLVLLLVSGANQVDLAAAQLVVGEKLERADPRLVRDRTGFAIGGVAPIGHLEPVPAFIDEDLMNFHVVWAAAGAPDAVFSAEPQQLVAASNAVVARLKA